MIKNFFFFNLLLSTTTTIMNSGSRALEILCLKVAHLVLSPIVLYYNTLAWFINPVLLTILHTVVLLNDLFMWNTTEVPWLRTFVLHIMTALQVLYTVLVIKRIKIRERVPGLRPRDHFVNWVVITLFAMLFWNVVRDQVFNLTQPIYSSSS